MVRASWLLALGGLLIGGCSGGASPPIGMDAAVRDATVVDSAQPDASAADGGIVPDAAPSDAGDWLTCPTPVCDPREAGTCGDKVCVLSAATPDCVTTHGDAGEGDPCSATTDCLEGLGCFAHGADAGVCGRLCCPGDDSVCGTEELCAGTGMLVNGIKTPWGRCLLPRPCDVLRPNDACEPGEGCYIVSAAGGTDCLRAGTAGAGDPCTAQNDCAPGLFCGGLTHMTCLRICSLGDAGVVPCPSGEQCRAYSHTPDGTGLCTSGTTTSAP